MPSHAAACSWKSLPSSNLLAKDVYVAARDVRRELGPGLYESAYVRLLVHYLSLRGHKVEQQVPIHLRGQDVDLGIVGRIDLVVDGALAVECKAVAALHPIHEAQLLTYLRVGRYPLGLLLNFHAIPFATGVRRKVNSLAFDRRPSAPRGVAGIVPH